MIVLDGDEFLTVEEAATRLGIKPASLYAYVSRGVHPELPARDQAPAAVPARRGGGAAPPGSLHRGGPGARPRAAASAGGSAPGRVLDPGVAQIGNTPRGADPGSAPIVIRDADEQRCAGHRGNLQPRDRGIGLCLRRGAPHARRPPPVAADASVGRPARGGRDRPGRRDRGPGLGGPVPVPGGERLPVHAGSERVRRARGRTGAASGGGCWRPSTRRRGRAGCTRSSPTSTARNTPSIALFKRWVRRGGPPDGGRPASSTGGGRSCCCSRSSDLPRPWLRPGRRPGPPGAARPPGPPRRPSGRSGPRTGR